MKIYSIHFNRPDFVTIQNECCKKFGYDFIVVNNGANEKIHNACINHGIKEIQTNNIGANSISHANSINQLFRIIPEPEDCGIIDHDLFLKGPLDFKNNNIIALKQSRGSFSYFWPGFLFWKKDVAMKNVDFFPNNLGDTGSNTNSILKYLESKICYVKEKHVCNQDECIQKNGYSELYLDDKLVAIHAINGSGWHSAFSEDKKQTLNSLIRQA